MAVVELDCGRGCGRQVRGASPRRGLLLRALGPGRGGTPGGRYDGAMVYDSLRDQYILFGGYDGVEITGTTQIFNPTTRKWTEITTSPQIPAGRLYHCMTYDKARDRVVLFGGFNGDILGD